MGVRLNTLVTHRNHSFLIQSCFDTKSFQYKLKQSNCTILLFTSSIWFASEQEKHFGRISLFFKPSMWNYFHLSNE